MTGDQSDMQSRLRALMPKSWLPKLSPNFDASLQGVSWALSTVYANITYAALQTRINTATDGWLDIISGDFFGAFLPRNANELDGSFRTRILANLFIKGPTRADMSKVLTLITGRAPSIFEPSNTTDSGGWDDSIYWDISGNMGDPMPYQAFVTAYRPVGGQVDLGEWDSRMYFDIAGYFSDSSPNAITDAAIIAAVESTRALGTLIWMRIADSPVTP